MGKRVSHPVNATALVRRVEHPPRGSPQPLVVIGDHQLHAAQATVGERAQEVGPERFCFGWTGGDAENFALAVLVHSYRYYHGAADDPPALAHFHVGRVEPEIGPGAFERPGEECIHSLVDFDTKATDLALRHAASAHRLHQIVYGARRDPVDVSLLDHRHQRLLSSPSRLQEAGQVAPLSQPRNFQRDPPGTSVPVAVPVTVPLNLPQGRANALPGTGSRLNLHFHDPLGREGQHLAHEIAIGLLLNQLNQRHSVVGHRHLRSWFKVLQPEPSRRSAVAASVTPGRALRYAGGSARGLLHQALGHYPSG